MNCTFDLWCSQGWAKGAFFARLPDHAVVYYLQLPLLLTTVSGPEPQEELIWENLRQREMRGRIWLMKFLGEHGLEQDFEVSCFNAAVTL